MAESEFFFGETNKRIEELNANLGNVPVIKTNSFTGTTSGSGNVSKVHAGRVIVLSA